MKLTRKITEKLQSNFSLVLSKPTRILAVSPDVYELLGYKADEFLTGELTLQSLIHPHDQDIADELFSRKIKTSTGSLNIRIRHADGKIRCMKGQFKKVKDPIDNNVLLELLLQDAKSLWQNQDDIVIAPSFKAMMENTNDYIFFKDRNHVFTGASQTLVAVTDPSEYWTDLIGQTDYDVFPEEYADRYYSLEKQVFAGADIAHEVQETIDKTGKKGWVDNRKGPIRNAENEIIGLFGLARDITEINRSHEVFRILAERGEGAKDNILELIVQQMVLSQDVRYALIGYVNPTDPLEVRTLAVCADGSIVDNFTYMLKGTPCQNVLNENQECYYPDNIQHQFPDDHMLVELDVKSYLGFPLRDSAHNLLGIIAILDIKMMDKNRLNFGIIDSLATRAGIELERNLYHKKNMLASRVFDNTREAIIITDKDNNVIDVNPAFNDITGYHRDEILGENIGILDSGKESPELNSEILNTLEDKGHWQGEIWSKKKNGELFAQLATISTLFDDKDNQTSYVRLFSDITQAKQQQEKLHFMAHYDGLTGLPNRTLFADRFHQAIAHSKRTGHQLAICFVDLDNFKPINDNYGHEMGDKLLVEVSKRIVSCLREEDTVSRQGGDEFTLLLNDIESSEQCEKTLERIHLAIAQPYVVDDYIHKVTATTGATLYPFDKGDLDTLLRHADQAMYEAKLSGKNIYKVFSPEQNKLVLKKHYQFKEIEQALLKNEFELHYQIQVDDSAQPKGAEVLIRWLHPKRGMVSPIEFIPLAEESNLILSIGQWVLDSACRKLKEWEKNSLTSPLTLSVNVSPKQFHQPDFTEHVLATVRQHSVNPNKLKLELTESMLAEDLDRVTATMAALTKAGIRFELDDFGSGYSSMRHLKNLPLERLKIDQSFVSDIAHDISDQAIVSAIITMARSLGLEVIAEGVETEEQLIRLRDKGCRNYQGYLFSQPLPIDEFELLIESIVNDGYCKLASAQNSNSTNLISN